MPYLTPFTWITLGVLATTMALLAIGAALWITRPRKQYRDEHETASIG